MHNGWSLAYFITLWVYTCHSFPEPFVYQSPCFHLCQCCVFALCDQFPPPIIFPPCRAPRSLPTPITGELFPSLFWPTATVVVQIGCVFVQVDVQMSCPEHMHPEGIRTCTSMCLLVIWALYRVAGLGPRPVIPRLLKFFPFTAWGLPSTQARRDSHASQILIIGDNL